MPTAALQAGQVVLDSFRLERQLGAGTYAIAYLAQQLGTDRRAVVKVPHPHLLAGPHGREIRRRFGVEARAATRVSHPNLVTVYTVGETEQGIPAIAMEFVDGEPLSTRLNAKAPLPIDQLGALGEQLGEALLALHQAGIVHRDLAPGNVMVRNGTSGLVAKLLDFGVAKLLDAPTRTLGPMGTPGYLAPEQLQGQVTPRSDVYSLGAILWWALTGRERPDDYADGSLRAQLGASQGPDPLSLRPNAPPRLAAVISRMLVPAHEHRLDVDAFLGEWRAALAATAAPQLVPRSGSWSGSDEHRRTTPLRSPTVAVVVGNSILRTLTASYLDSRGDLDIVTCDARELTRANPGTYAAAVLDADLPGVDIRELLQVLSECHEELALVVIGSAEQADTYWAAYGATAFVKLPEELEQLRGVVYGAVGRGLTTGALSSGRLSVPVVEGLRARGQLHASLNGFIGDMPQWIGDLQVALATEPERASAPCRQLLASAESLGLRDLARLARAACAFLSRNDFEGAAAFAVALEREYHEVFPEVFELMMNSGPVETTTT
ncbi:Serine/threonine-protein kinase Pkn1 [Enhygromyxa salina]|uniref:Serine/threonine-protein kinase Pkn1 n=1 Tax=Enhygromyxa salina TaxID=215803 RepID=A0A2S9YDH0_9BACT|nr:serine/threonine-protein kinase [Enhygromyxa salina]PRQ03061.1 Serine/threonine-protein kinase Pkn1 [Enhygromyxa salina]